MKQDHLEFVGKVFVVVGSMRRCLICDGMFTPTQAANHATIPCCPNNPDAEQDKGTLDPCFPFLPPIDSSSSQGQA